MRPDGQIRVGTWSPVILEKMVPFYAAGDRQEKNSAQAASVIYDLGAPVAYTGPARDKAFRAVSENNRRGPRRSDHRERGGMFSEVAVFAALAI